MNNNKMLIKKMNIFINENNMIGILHIHNLKNQQFYFIYFTIYHDLLIYLEIILDMIFQILKNIQFME